MDETLGLLRSWCTPEEVIKNFNDNEISKETFRDLTDLYLKELCPHMGQRIQLKNNIQDWLDSVADTEEITESTNGFLNSAPCSSNTNVGEDAEYSLPNLSFSDITNILLDNYNRPPLPDFDIKTLLQTSAHGNSILNYYNQYKILNAQKRNILVDIIVKHIYTYIVNNKIRPHEFNLIAAKIVTLFPCENVASYYMTAVSTSKSSTGKYIPAKGKLVDKVRNLLYISGERHRTKSAQNLNDTEKENIISFDTTRNDDNVLWLQNNEAPWEEVVEKWKLTLPFRTRQENLATVHEFLINWPILKVPEGHVLINYDFEQKFPEKSLNFVKNWHSFFEKLLQFKQKEIKNKTGLILLENLSSITNEDKKIPVQMTLLGYLVPPKGRLNRKIKYSSIEAIEGLIVQINNAGDIDSTIKNQVEKYKKRKQPVQPYILLLGSLHNFSAIYIVIDDVKYVFQTASKAFDTLFKSYHVLHAKYPEAGEYLYLLIQRMVYSISTQYDRIPPHIVEVLNLK